MMHSSPTPLRTAFEAAQIVRIAIVDDGYDPPSKQDIHEDRWAEFAEAFDEQPGVFAGRLTRGATALNQAPAFGDLRPEDIRAIWDAYLGWRAQNPNADADGIFSAASKLFSRYYALREGKLAELSHVEQFARDATGHDPDRLPSTAKGHQLANYDLVLLDFYLGDEDGSHDVSGELQAKARRNAQDRILETIDASLPHHCPLFVLISSRATEEDVPSFRDEARLLASKFRFLTKPEFKDARLKTDYMLSTLASQRDPANAVEQLLRNWTHAVSSAMDQMLKSVRRLDVADYAYVQNYRLKDEKVSLLEYLTWMFNAYLGSLVESEISDLDGAAISKLKEAANLPPVLRPMSELPRIYTDITTSQVNMVDHEDQPVKVWTGDLFVRRDLLPSVTAEDNTKVPPGTENRSPEPQSGAAQDQEHAVVSSTSATIEQSGDRPKEAGADAGEQSRQPDVLAVVTPVCDLVPTRVKVKSVVLVGGTLKEFGKASEPSNHLLVLDRPERLKDMNSKAYQVDWDNGWPQAYSYESFTGVGIRGTEYVKIGRLREIYAAELAGALAGGLGRVGVPVAPPFSHALETRILYRPNGVGKAALLFEASLDAPRAWELYRARNKPTRLCGLDADIIWPLLEAAAIQNLPDTHPAATILRDPEVWRPLTRPFEVRDKPTSPSGSTAGLGVIRIGEQPATNEISDNNMHVLIQLIGPLHEKADKKP